MKLFTKIKLILFVILIAGLVSCGETQENLQGRIPGKMITEAEALDIIAKTYESAYLQGAQDVMNKWLEWVKNGERERLEVDFFMELKNKRVRDFLAGKKS